MKLMSSVRGSVLYYDYFYPPHLVLLRSFVLTDLEIQWACNIIDKYIPIHQLHEECTITYTGYIILLRFTATKQVLGSNAHSTRLKHNADLNYS